MTSLATVKEPGVLAEEALRLLAKRRNLGKKITLRHAAELVVEKQKYYCVNSQTVYEIATGLRTIRQKKKNEEQDHFSYKTDNGEALRAEHQKCLERYNIA